MRSRIEAVYSKIGPKLARTPVKDCLPLETSLDCRLHFKMENVQITGSFKLRGVLSKFSELADSGMEFDQVVAASTGNHALAVCHAARAYQVSPVIFVPENVSGSKLSKIEALGVEVHLKGAQSGETEQIAIAYAQKNQIPLIHPYNDPAVIAGQGTIGLELHEQLKCLDQVFVPVGGGGLISGIAAYLKEARPETKVIGVQPENANEMAASVAKGKIVEPSSLHTISDGTAGGLDPDTITYRYCKGLVDEFVLVEEIEIVNALKLIEIHMGLRVEPAAALALAGMLKNKQRIAGMSCTGIICGGNIALEQYQQVVSMKFAN